MKTMKMHQKILSLIGFAGAFYLWGLIGDLVYTKNIKFSSILKEAEELKNDKDIKRYYSLSSQFIDEIDENTFRELKFLRESPKVKQHKELENKIEKIEQDSFYSPFAYISGVCGLLYGLYLVKKNER